jgi:uncharacterized protein DUF3800
VFLEQVFFIAERLGLAHGEADRVLYIWARYLLIVHPADLKSLKMGPMYRVFIDEVGNHDMKSSDDPNHRYLGLTGVIMTLEYEAGEFTTALNSLKQDMFGTRQVALHRREMMDAKPPFERLGDAGVRKQCDLRVLQLVTEAWYLVFTVVIDKKEHKERYVVWQFHPYHYCLTVLLERYVLRLHRLNQVGDVLIESRAKKENRQLERAYKYIYQNGSNQVPAILFQRRLTSGQLKIKPKTANVAGLQLADVIANPSCRSLICQKTGVQMTAEFGRQIEAILSKNKYLRRYDGEIWGWGKKWLP